MGLRSRVLGAITGTLTSLYDNAVYDDTSWYDSLTKRQRRALDDLNAVYENGVVRAPDLIDAINKLTYAYVDGKVKYSKVHNALQRAADYFDYDDFYDAGDRLLAVLKRVDKARAASEQMAGRGKTHYVDPDVYKAWQKTRPGERDYLRYRTLCDRHLNVVDVTSDTDFVTCKICLRRL